MELIRKGQSLKIIFLKYLFSVGVGLLLAIGLSIMTFDVFYNLGLIMPANYTENQILKNKSDISNSEKFDESLLPKHTSYVYLSLDGDIIQSNMSEEIKWMAKGFHDGEVISTPSISFIEIKRSDGYIVINYQVVPFYTNTWMERHFPKINSLFITLLIVFCFISTTIITLIWVRRITKQLLPMLEASDKIAKQELDFEIGSSNIKEFNDVLNGLEKMKMALGDSLRENWIQEENKRSQISALTHDLKTPISVVQGNAELLNMTELTNEQKTYVEYIIKNSARISDYTKSLMTMNNSSKLEFLNLQKVKVSEIIARVREIAKEITLVNERALSESVNDKDAFVDIDIKLFERVIQNVLSNAVQYSPDETNIELIITAEAKKLSISVVDSGFGFSDEDLIRGAEPFYRGDKSRHSSTNYGLGLYNASKIMSLHNGRIILENNFNKNGAKVKLELPLL